MTAVTRIAIVSDVHGNLPALEAVLEELERQEPFDRVVGGGDYTSGGVFPQEALDRQRRLGWDFVRGNADEEIVEVATRGRVPAQGRVGNPPSGEMLESLRWVAERLDEESIEFLAGLPISWSIEGPSGKRLVYVHSTPSSTHPVISPEASEDEVNALLDEAQADVLLHGHIHYAYVRPLGERVIASVGSVGYPFDRDPRPCFLIATDDGTGWTLSHQRVSYDNEAYIGDLNRSAMPTAGERARLVREATP